MTEPPDLDRFPWKILSSTSRFFPAESLIRFKKTPLPEGFEIEVSWEELEQLKLKLPDSTFLEGPRGTLKGDFRHPREQKGFELVVTFCPETAHGLGPILFGILREKSGGVETGGTGVWVAEEQGPPKKRPRKRG